VLENYADVAAAGGHGEVGMHSTECHLVCFIFTHFRNRLRFNVQSESTSVHHSRAIA